MHERKRSPLEGPYNFGPTGSRAHIQVMFDPLRLPEGSRLGLKGRLVSHWAGLDLRQGIDSERLSHRTAAVRLVGPVNGGLSAMPGGGPEDDDASRMLLGRTTTANLALSMPGGFQ